MQVKVPETTAQWVGSSFSNQCPVNWESEWKAEAWKEQQLQLRNLILRPEGGVHLGIWTFGFHACPLVLFGRRWGKKEVVVKLFYCVTIRILKVMSLRALICSAPEFRVICWVEPMSTRVLRAIAEQVQRPYTIELALLNCPGFCKLEHLLILFFTKNLCAEGKKNMIEA